MSDLIALDPVTAKERRAMRRKEKKEAISAREAMVAQKKIPPPDKRVSAYGNMYPGAKESDWAYYDKDVWIHGKEMHAFSREFCQCSISKRWAFTHSMLLLHDGTHAHPDVLAESGKYGRCSYSGNYYPKEMLTEVWTNLTDKCTIANDYLGDYPTCDIDGRRYSRGYMLILRPGQKWKRVAKHHLDYKDKVGRCEVCGNYFDAVNTPMRQKYGIHVCEPCFDIKEMGAVIHPHNYNKYPEPIYTHRTIRRMAGGEPRKDEHGWTFYESIPGRGRKCVEQKDPDIRLFGWEAETEIFRKSAQRDGLNRFKLAHQVMKVLGSDFVVVKEDGTLTANEHYGRGTGFSGFEIVSAPADLAAHRKLVPKLHEVPGFKHFRAWDEYDTCGFHVHVSRESLTSFQIGRMLMFINHKDNAKFIHRVAGRGSDRFCKYIPKEPRDKTHPAADVLYPSERVINKGEDDRRNRSRRVALNLANAKTVEFRIFRGTMHPRHILRNLEFCDAVCDYCYPGNFSLGDMADYTKFISFVSKNRKRWPLLAEWLIEQKIIEMKKLGAMADRSKLTVDPEKVVEAERKPKELSGEEQDLIEAVEGSMAIPPTQYWTPRELKKKAEAYFTFVDPQTIKFSDLSSALAANTFQSPPPPGWPEPDDHQDPQF